MSALGHRFVRNLSIAAFTLLTPLVHAQATGAERARAVEAALAADPTLADADIHVDPSGAAVVLRGEVPTALDRARALEIARAVPGVGSVVDRLTVVTAERTDDEIRTDLIAAFERDPAIARYRLGIVVDQGRVTLSGTVASAREKQRAVALARALPGVVGVQDTIGVAARRFRSDQELQAEISASLRSSAAIDGSNVRVVVSRRVVRLRGSVPTAEQRARAVELAWTAGVDDVVDELAVRPVSDDASPTTAAQDQAIKAAVDAALAGDPWLGGGYVTTHVERGVVVLTGIVPTLSARWAALRAAGSARGVADVVDRLVVRPPPRTDAQVRADVRSAFAADETLRDRELDATVQAGKAVLRGTVTTTKEREHAAAVAATVPGVRAIDNRVVLGR